VLWAVACLATIARRKNPFTNLYGYVAANPIQFIDPTGFVRWKYAGNAFLGILGNGAGMIVCGALLAAPEPTMATKIIGGAVLTKSTAGFGLSFYNFTSAFTQESNQYDAPSSLARVGATIINSCNSDLLKYADILDLTLDFASGRVIIGSVPVAGSLLNKSVSFSGLNKAQYNQFGQPLVNVATDTLQATQAIVASMDAAMSLGR